MSTLLHQVNVTADYQILASDDMIRLGADTVRLTLPLIDNLSVRDGWEIWIWPGAFVNIGLETLDSAFHETGGTLVTFNTNLQACKIVKAKYMASGWFIEYDFVRYHKFLSFQVVDSSVVLTAIVFRNFITIPQQFAGWFITKVTYANAVVGSGGGSTKIELVQNGTTQASTQVTIGSGIIYLTSYPHLQVLEGDYIQASCTTLTATPPEGLAIAIEFSPY